MSSDMFRTRTNARPAGTARAARRVGALATLSALALTMTGCNNALEGGLAGGALGALGGLAIGGLTGNEGEGAVIGAVSGAALGGIIGDQNRRNAEYRYGGGYGGGHYDRDYGNYYYQERTYYQPRYRGREHYSPYCD